MASTPTDGGAAACAASATWLCGVITSLAEAELLFARHPWIGFVLVSMIGGFIGWCILLERGAFDDDTPGRVFRRFISRVSIGGAIGAAAAMIWGAYDGVDKGLPMLTAALVAVFPVESYRGGLKRLQNILREAFK